MAIENGSTPVASFFRKVDIAGFNLFRFFETQSPIFPSARDSSNPSAKISFCSDMAGGPDFPGLEDFLVNGGVFLLPPLETIFIVPA